MGALSSLEELLALERRQLRALFSTHAKIETLLRMRRSVEGLSGAEIPVFELLRQRLANKAIADRLHISERTVKFHVRKILSKAGVRSRTDLWEWEP